jgi:hypothetical protein
MILLPHHASPYSSTWQALLTKLGKIFFVYKALSFRNVVIVRESELIQLSKGYSLVEMGVKLNAIITHFVS